MTPVSPIAVPAPRHATAPARLRCRDAHAAVSTSAVEVIAIEHLLGMAHVTVERWEAVKDALELHRRGLDFADALHWASSASCNRFVTFDDRGFARRTKGIDRSPPVALPWPEPIAERSNPRRPKI